MAKVLLFLIRAYQLTLSVFLGNSCRYQPTCSHYAAIAIRTHGAWPGSWLAISRICRCHPWGGQGVDVVPERLEMRYGLFSAWRYGRWSRNINVPSKRESDD
ncbi:MAG: membrane protein insertion efficiency factor YidD [Pseudomonadota bacterium]